MLSIKEFQSLSGQIYFRHVHEKLFGLAPTQSVQNKRLKLFYRFGTVPAIESLTQNEKGMIF